jgi:hypothetical protein
MVVAFNPVRLASSLIIRLTWSGRFCSLHSRELDVMYSTLYSAC